MPSGLENTAMLACSTLSNPNTRPTIIIVDALNQASIVIHVLPYPSNIVLFLIHGNNHVFYINLV